MSKYRTPMYLRRARHQTDDVLTRNFILLPTVTHLLSLWQPLIPSETSARWDIGYDIASTGRQTGVKNQALVWGVKCSAMWDTKKRNLHLHRIPVTEAWQSHGAKACSTKGMQFKGTQNYSPDTGSMCSPPPITTLPDPYIFSFSGSRDWERVLHPVWSAIIPLILLGNRLVLGTSRSPFLYI